MDEGGLEVGISGLYASNDKFEMGRKRWKSVDHHDNAVAKGRYGVADVRDDLLRVDVGELRRKRI